VDTLTIIPKIRGPNFPIRGNQSGLGAISLVINDVNYKPMSRNNYIRKCGELPKDKSIWPKFTSPFTFYKWSTPINRRQAAYIKSDALSPLALIDHQLHQAMDKAETKSAAAYAVLVRK
jgi:hypothetical protein